MKKIKVINNYLKMQTFVLKVMFIKSNLLIVLINKKLTRYKMNNLKQISYKSKYYQFLFKRFILEIELKAFI